MVNKKYKVKQGDSWKFNYKIMPNPILSVFTTIPQDTSTSKGATDRYKEIEAIAQYNREHGTNYYTMDQVNEQQRVQQRLQQLQQEAETSPTDIGEDVHAAYVAARQPKSIADVYDVENFEDSAKATNIAGLGAVGMGLTLGAASGAFGLPVADITNTLFAADAVKNLASGEGVQKTIRFANEGN